MSLIANGAGESGSSNFYNGVATTSVRFESGDSAFLGFTPSSAGNRKTMTFSAWVKRSKLGEMRIFSSGDDNYLAFGGADIIELNLRNGGSGSNVFTETNAKFRDLSAWYHIVLALDTTQGTDTNRVKVYVNGSQITSFSSAAYPGQNNDMNSFNNAEAQHIGRLSSSSYFSGYIAEVNFIDGLALTPSSFGEMKGVWIAKDTSGLTFGNQGYRLQMKQTGVGTASTSTIGADTSGNTNHWTSGNIVASDCAMPDSSENNFNTFSPLIPFDSGTLTEGNLKSNNVLGGSNVGPMSAFGVTTGKWFCEMYIHDIGGGDYVYAGAFLKRLDSSTRFGIDLAVPYDGSVYFEGAAQGSSLETSANGHIYGFAVDCDNFTAQVYKTVGGTYGTYGPEVDWSGSAHKNSGYMGIGHFGASSTSGRDGGITVNYGQDPSFAGAITAGTETPSEGAGVFKLAPPSGYLALCTANLPEPTIGPNSDTQADDHFNSVLYTGNATDDRVVTTGLQTDWVWGKHRGNTDYHRLYDSSRGALKHLASNASDSESNGGDGGVKSFTSTGFTLDNTGYLNDNSGSYVSWNWKANGGTTSSNSDGSITSTVQANTTAGFSIVLYAGSESNATVGHGLGGVPDMLIWKKRNGANDWIVYHSANTSAPATDHLHLNTTAATSDPSGSTFFQDTLPTSTVFSIGTDDDVNDAKNYVVYCFRSIEGYSKMGSFTGNGSSDGTFCFTNFAVKWLMVKWTGGASSWFIHDNKRNTFNVTDDNLYPNLNAAEEAQANWKIDFLSNGFKLRPDAITNENNGSGQTYIYMAFGSSFKYATAR